jgi:hypothetical protein
MRRKSQPIWMSLKLAMPGIKQSTKIVQKLLEKAGLGSLPKSVKHNKLKLTQ